MFCPNCGNNCGDANFCSNCGQNLRRVVIGNNEPDIEPEKKTESQETVVVEYPNPPIGRYNNHDHDYLELDVSSVTIYKKPPLAKPTKRMVPYSQIKGILYAEATKFKHGGFLSLQTGNSSSKAKSNFTDAISDELSIVFSWKQNDSFLTVYEFLKSFADRATKNHQVEKWPTSAQQMIDDAIEAREYEKQNGYVSAQTIASSLETYDVEKRTWYPGKKKDERKAKKAELDKSDQVYCPKCLSTSVSANQKGFGFVRGALGASIGLDAGMIVGGIGSKRIVCTCLKCGHQWKPGKK